MIPPAGYEIFDRRFGRPVKSRISDLGCQARAEECDSKGPVIGLDNRQANPFIA